MSAARREGGRTRLAFLSAEERPEHPTGTQLGTRFGAQGRMGLTKHRPRLRGEGRRARQIGTEANWLAVVRVVARDLPRAVERLR
eukprot:5467488-Pyramimonas_sp.AAC.1